MFGRFEFVSSMWKVLSQINCSDIEKYKNKMLKKEREYFWGLILSLRWHFCSLSVQQQKTVPCVGIHSFQFQVR